MDMTVTQIGAVVVAELHAAGYTEVAAPRMTSPWLSWRFVVCGWFVLATAG